MKRKPRLYNSRLTNVYVEYLEKYYPDLDTNEILAYAGMTRLEIEDPAHWFSQRQVDRFHAILSRKIKNGSIARAVGRYAISSEALGAIKKIALSLINPASIYMLMGKLYPLATRSVRIETRRLAVNRVEIAAMPYPGVHEKPFQCENRTGSFEAVGKHFSTQYAKVEHPLCIHRGDSCCLYRIEWQKSPTLSWKRMRNHAAGGGLLLSSILIFVMPIPTWLIATLAMVILVLAISTRLHLLAIQDLTKAVKAQGDVAQEHLEGIKAQYNRSLLIEEIGQATSTLMDPHTLFEAVTGIMAERLDYDRGMIFLADTKKEHLRFAAGYGFDDRGLEILRQIDFRLNKPSSRGIFTRCFLDQQPVIVQDVHELKRQFTDRSQRLIEIFKPQALISVPIIYENMSLGVLSVDNHISKRKLQQNDLNLLKGLAANLATSINNSISFDKLRDSEEKYRDMFENVSDFLYFHDLDGTIRDANRALSAASGYDKATLNKMMISDLLPFKFSDRYPYYLREVLDSGTVEGVAGIRKQDGGRLVVEYKSSLVMEDGRPAGVRGSARDITERWEARKERKRLEEKLDRAKKMEAVGTLAGGVAHDLNNILSGIVSYPELLLMDLPSDSSLREPLTIIQESGRRASAMVQDLLTMARRGVTVAEVVNLNAVVQSYVKSPECKKLAAYHPNVRFSLDLDETLSNIEGSPVHLSKTLMNLVSNAAEAMPEGGKLTIRTRNQYIDKPIRGYDDLHEGDYVVLTVSDTGVGISKKDQKHVFEPFYTKKVMGRSGTGLGMSVVWATVKDHKGYIDISSQKGHGTHITLYFPITEKEIASRTETIPMEALAGRGESILVVDDAKEQREIANLMLTKLGYRVTTVASGEAAVEHIKTHQVDLVVLDMIMDPGMDGLTTYKEIVRLNPSQRAIVASGFSESERVKEAQKLGVGAYVKKPYVMRDIGMAIRAELDR